MEAEPQHVTQSTLATLMQLHFNNGNFQEAIHVFGSCSTYEVEADRDMFSVALECFQKLNEKDNLIDALDSMISHDYYPSIRDFNTALMSLATHGTEEEIVSLRKQMRLFHIEEDSLTHDLLGLGYYNCKSIFPLRYVIQSARGAGYNCRNLYRLEEKLCSELLI